MEKIYTNSAIVGIICKLIATDKYSKIVESFKYNTSGTLLFNPLDDAEVNDIFIQKTEEFPNFVKEAVIWYLCGGNQGYLASILRKDLKIILTTENLIKLSEWNSKYEGIPISAKVQIIGSLTEETYIKSGECYCIKCGHREKISSLATLPAVCENKECDSRRIVIDQAKTRTGDIKTIIVQEMMEDVKHGMSVMKKCVVKDDLVFDSFPGQRKILTGVFRSVPKKNSERNQIVINAISMQSLDDETLRLPNELQIAYFHQLAKNKDYLQIITDSYAPKIKFRHLEKMAIILARIGSTKTNSISGNLDTLLVGPPATGKSKMLEFLAKVTQRSGFATGGTSTTASITVVMTTLPDKTKFPKAGIIPECNNSCVALDELNQFPSEDLGKLYESMSSGRIHYDKGGFKQEFLANTTIIAGANPKNGFYEPVLGMVKNVNLPYALLSRFRLVVNVLPESSEIESQQISDHITLLHEISLGQYLKENKLLTEEELLLLFNFANSLDVKLSHKAKILLDNFYNTMRHLQKSGEQEDNSKPIDMRFYEGILMVAEAITKLHLQTEITDVFAVMAIDFVKKTLETFGLKTERGMQQIPMEQQDTKDKDVIFEKCWIQMCKDANNEYLSEDSFIQYLVEQRPDKFDRTRAADLFDTKHKKGDLQKNNGRFKMVK